MFLFTIVDQYGQLPLFATSIIHFTSLKTTYNMNLDVIFHNILERTYRPKFKPIYKVEKYNSMVTSERPHKELKIQFL